MLIKWIMETTTNPKSKGFSYLDEYEKTKKRIQALKGKISDEVYSNYLLILNNSNTIFNDMDSFPYNPVYNDSIYNNEETARILIENLNSELSLIENDFQTHK